MPYIIRLAKAIMFAFPDNTPDLDSLIRLWLHEMLRVLYDRELNVDVLQAFLDNIDQILEDQFRTNIEKLFPSRASNAEDDDEEDFYGVSQFIASYNV